MINEEKQNADALKQMIASLPNFPAHARALNTYGAMVKDAELTFECPALKMPIKLRYCFLMTKGIIICKAKGAIYHFKAAIGFDDSSVDYKVEEAPESKSGGEVRHHWQLRTTNKSRTDVVHIFSAQSIAVKKKFMAEVQDLILTIKASKENAPAYMSRAELNKASGKIATASVLGTALPALKESPRGSYSRESGRCVDGVGRHLGLTASPLLLCSNFLQLSSVLAPSNRQYRVCCNMN